MLLLAGCHLFDQNEDATDVGTLTPTPFETLDTSAAAESGSGESDDTGTGTPRDTSDTTPPLETGHTGVTHTGDTSGTGQPVGTTGASGDTSPPAHSDDSSCPTGDTGAGAGVYQPCMTNADCRGGLICACGDDDSATGDSGGSYCVPCGYYSCYD